ncbi:MAG: PHB depolymerase family esterase [Gammaproteobacteria bacterium]|nr:PHB depolymerase family esterase [Gammaproteobacteria bacterium]
MKNIITALFLTLLSVSACSKTMSDNTRLTSAVDNFGANPGNLTMTLVTEPSSTSLVVLLHGCTQDGSRYAKTSGWLQLSQQHQFDLLLPQQQTHNNAKKCFNWYQLQDISIDQGELQSIISMITFAKQQRKYQDVYISGISAGGAMAMALISNNPEQFSGAGIIAGISYRCGLGLFPALQCMKSGKNTAMESFDLTTSSTWPALSVWHGAADKVVSPKNSRDIIEQWQEITNQTDLTEVSLNRSKTWQQVSYSRGNKVMIQHNVIEQLGHSQSVDHDQFEAVDYMTNNGIATAKELAKFFNLVQ